MYRLKVKETCLQDITKQQGIDVENLVELVKENKRTQDGIKVSIIGRKFDKSRKSLSSLLKSSFIIFTMTKQNKNAGKYAPRCYSRHNTLRS